MCSACAASTIAYGHARLGIWLTQSTSMRADEHTCTGGTRHNQFHGSALSVHRARLGTSSIQVCMAAYSQHNMIASEVVFVRQDWSSKSGALTGSGVLSGNGSSGMLHGSGRMVSSAGTLDRFSPAAAGRLSPINDSMAESTSSAGLTSRQISDDLANRHALIQNIYVTPLA